MKQFLLSILALFTFAVSAAETSTLDIVVNVRGNLTADDKRGLLFVVGSYNEAIYATNGIPLATNTVSALRTSYEVVLSNKVQQAHYSYLKDAKSAAAAKALIKDEEVSQRISSAVIDAITAGKSIEQIITAIGQ